MREFSPESGNVDTYGKKTVRVGYLHLRVCWGPVCNDTGNVQSMDHVGNVCVQAASSRPVRRGGSLGANEPPPPLKCHLKKMIRLQL